MDNIDIILGIVLGIVAIISLGGVWFCLWSTKVATLIMVIFPFVINLVIVQIRGGETLEVMCVGSLLAVAFGPATYAVGRIIEKKAKEDQITKKK